MVAVGIHYYALTSLLLCILPEQIFLSPVHHWQSCFYHRTHSELSVGRLSNQPDAEAQTPRWIPHFRLVFLQIVSKIYYHILCWNTSLKCSVIENSHSRKRPANLCETLFLKWLSLHFHPIRKPEHQLAVRLYEHGIDNGQYNSETWLKSLPQKRNK